jgi:8-oxo-dGTP pyrophosphatase MutT (NUDIX family)
MLFIQKIYYNNKPLILTTSAGEYIKQHPNAGAYLSFTGSFPRNFRLAIEHLDKPRTLGAIIEDISQRSLQEELHAIYQPVMAGGGVVLNENDAVLMIFRRGKWDLPKGKMDEGEDISTCALREVREETGLQHLKLKDKICDTYHIYSQYNQNLLKCTTWYRMKAAGSEKLVPQAEENILEARWIPESELAPIVFKSYEAIREVLQEAGFRW